MMSAFRCFRENEEGQSSVEYALLIAFLVLAIIVSAKGYRASISGVASVTNSSLAAANSAPNSSGARVAATSGR